MRSTNKSDVVVIAKRFRHVLTEEIASTALRLLKTFLISSIKGIWPQEIRNQAVVRDFLILLQIVQITDFGKAWAKPTVYTEYAHLCWTNDTCQR